MDTSLIPPHGDNNSPLLLLVTGEGYVCFHRYYTRKDTNMQDEYEAVGYALQWGDTAQQFTHEGLTITIDVECLAHVEIDEETSKNMTEQQRHALQNVVGRFLKSMHPAIVWHKLPSDE